MTNRIATFQATDRLITDNLRLQSLMNDTQVQLSTGLKSLNYKGIANESQRLLNLEKSKTNLENYNVNGKSVSSNVNIMYNNVNGMIGICNSFMSTLTAALGGSQVPSAVTQSQADLLRNEMAGLLNTSSAGRYLFAGSMIDSPPVDLNDPGYTAQTSPSTADTSYYQGDTTVLKVQMSETLTVNYGVTANNPAFEKALRAFSLVFNNPADHAAIAEASTLMQDAIAGMGNLQSQLSTSSRTIADQMLRNQEDMSTMDEVIASIKNVDLAATTVKQKEIESQIQASYASSVKILNLKLTDYL